VSDQGHGTIIWVAPLRASLLEPTHNARFSALMDLYLPNWQHLRKQLNRLPVRHEDWHY
jgi:hypothetical protein